LNAEQAIVATTDFFTPIVDDPFDFGRIAATNALSDVYAMGGTPLLALALVGMPLKLLSTDIIREILRGGESVCAQAGIPMAGGHSIDAAEPIYGLAAIGVVHPARVKRNNGARAGDALVLGKPLGVGILSAALKQGQLRPESYAELIGLTTLLNRAGTALAALPAVHALTDVTGFGLLGHLLGMCRGSRLGAQLRMSDIPLLEHVLSMASAGIVTGASARNWHSYGADVQLAANLTAAQRDLLCDPQTSGGLLVACDPDALDEVLAILRRHNCRRAARIGAFNEGVARVAVAS
jgi:selenide, water dikinase